MKFRYQPLLSFTIFFVLFFTESNAQLDTEFWFAAPEVVQSHEDRPIRFRIATANEFAEVVISFPANDLIPDRRFTIPPNSTRTENFLTLINSVENTQYNTVANKGIKITSTASITVYYEVGQQFNVDLFALKGKNALGRDFVIPGQLGWSNVSFHQAFSTFDIVATEDNTVVSITPRVDVEGHRAGETFSVFLQEGETFSTRNLSKAAAVSLAGSLVKSTKPIAITIKDDSIVAAGGCFDLTGDQIVPIGILGQEYMLIQGQLNEPERAFVTAIQDGTQLFRGGSVTPFRTLNKGETASLFIFGIEYIQSTAPVYVMQYTGIGCEIGGALIPPVNCRGTRQLGFTRSQNEEFFLNILVRNGGQDEFRLNGSTSLINPNDFDIVPGTNNEWVIAQIEFPTNVIAPNRGHLIVNDSNSFQVGILEGGPSTGTRYGYFSNFSSLYIGDDFTLCEGESQVIEAIGDVGATYRWSTGNTSSSITVTAPGTYWVEMTNPSSCILYDTLQVFPSTPTIGALGDDLVGCEGTPLTIDSGPDFFVNQWSNGLKSETLTVTKPGDYWVELFDLTGCIIRDTINVSFDPPPFQLELGEDIFACSGDVIILSAVTEGATNPEYEWSVFSTDSVVQATRTGLYWVEVRADGCVQRDSIYLTFDDPFTIDLGEGLLRFCEGDSIILDATVASTPTLNPTYLWQDNSTNSTFTVTESGTYGVTVTRGGCQVVDSILVEVIPLPIFKFPADTTLCEGDSLTLRVPIDSVSYQWQDESVDTTKIIKETGIYWLEYNNGLCTFRDSIEVTFDNSLVFNIPSDTTLCEGETYVIDAFNEGAAYRWQDASTDSVFVVSEPGMYKVEINRGSCFITDSIEVSYQALPVFDLGQDSTLCVGDSLLLSIPLDGVEFAWQDGSTDSLFNLKETGIYWVDVTAGNCTVRDSIEVLFDEALSISFPRDTLLCEGEELIVDAYNAGATYRWQNGSTDSTFTVTEAGTYTVEITRGSCYLIDSIRVEYQPLPVFNLGSDRRLCEGDSIIAFVPLEGVEFSWQDGSTDSLFTIKETGIYWVDVTQGICTVRDSIEVIVDEAIEINFPRDTLLCEGEIYEIDVTNEGAVYFWQDSTTTATYTVSQPGKYKVAITRGACFLEDSIQVSYQSLPTFDLGTNKALCQGDSLILNVPLENVRFAWQDESTDSVFVVKETGVYWVDVTVANCTVRDSIEVTFDEVLSLDLLSDTVLCEGEVLALDVSNEGASYLWQDGSTESTFTITEAGTYRVRIDRGTCFAEDSIVVSYQALPVFDLGNDTTLCNGEILTLNVPLSNVSYAWQDGSTDSLLNVNFSGVYWVDVSVGNCTVRDSILVNYNPLPQAFPIEGSSVVCPGVVDVAYEVPSQTDVAYEWLIEGGSLVSGQGTHRISVDWGDANNKASIQLVQTNTFGCSNDTLVLDVRVSLVLEPETPTGDTLVCLNKKDGNVYTLANTNGSTYTWQVTGGEVVAGQGTAQATINWSGVGTHQVQVFERSVTSFTTCEGLSEILTVVVVDDPTEITLQNITLEEDNEQNANLRWEVNDATGIQNQLEVQRRTVGASSWQTVGQVPASTQQYTDAGINSSVNAFEYQVVALNNCNETLESGVHTTILLEGASNIDTDEISLTWSAYEGWQVQTYELWRKLDNEAEFTLYQSTNSTNFADLIAADGFEHQYRIKAIGNAPNQFSWSNSVRFSFDHPLTIPNVFTPNNDTFNDTFEIIKLELYRENELTIFNRWGEEVYHATNYANQWNGNDLPEGVYFYTLRIVRNGQEIKGQVSLLR